MTDDTARLAAHVPVIEGYCGESDIILTCICGWEQYDGTSWVEHLIAAGVTPPPSPDLVAAARAVVEEWDRDWEDTPLDDAIDALRAAIEEADRG